jgi:hypothetical protein
MALILTDQSGNEYALSVNSADGSLVTTPTSNVAPSSADNSIFFSVLQLITGALRLINVVASAELPSSTEANDALVAFQQMVDAWNAERLTIFSIIANDFSLTIGQQSFTLGPGGNFNTNRPPKIVGMSSILLFNPNNPVEEPITMYSWNQWQTQVPVKNVPGNFPLICYDDGGMPLRTLNFWPIPQYQQNNVRIYSWSPLIWPANLQTLINLPPAYARAFRYNLAVELAPEFGAQVPQSVMETAVSSLALIRTMNAPDLFLISDLSLTPAGYNYKADLFGIAY